MKASKYSQLSTVMIIGLFLSSNLHAIDRGPAAVSLDREVSLRDCAKGSIYSQIQDTIRQGRETLTISKFRNSLAKSCPMADTLSIDKKDGQYVDELLVESISEAVNMGVYDNLVTVKNQKKIFNQIFDYNDDIRTISKTMLKKLKEGSAIELDFSLSKKAPTQSEVISLSRCIKGVVDAHNKMNFNSMSSSDYEKLATNVKLVCLVQTDSVASIEVKPGAVGGKVPLSNIASLVTYEAWLKLWNSDKSFFARSRTQWEKESSFEAGIRKAFEKIGS